MVSHASVIAVTPESSTNEGVDASTTACPSCGGQRLRERGSLPDVDTVAGRKLQAALPGGSLLECEGCRMQFRWPRPSKLNMDQLYQLGDADHWDGGTDERPDWRMAAKWIEAMSAGPLADPSILDIACFDGRFLGLVDRRFDKSGIEIQSEAAARARAAGVQIIAADFEDLAVISASGSDHNFSVVTAFDILEHTHDPLHFVRLAIGALRPGGVLIVGTGNTDSPSWRWMGNAYWYCANPEHLSFINPAWCEWAAQQLGCEVDAIARLSHTRPTISKVCRETAMNGIFRIAPRMTRRCLAGYRRLVGSKKQTSASFRPPWFSARDHLLVQFRKPLG